MGTLSPFFFLRPGRPRFSFLMRPEGSERAEALCTLELSASDSSSASPASSLCGGVAVGDMGMWGTWGQGLGGKGRRGGSWGHGDSGVGGQGEAGWQLGTRGCGGCGDRAVGG